jgi:hypothetical protein
MAYIDLTKITYRYAQDLIARDPDYAQLCLDNAEVDTRVEARDKEVKAVDIPLTDPDEFIQSEMLYMFCKWRFLYHLFSGVTGSFELEDVYKQESMVADMQSQKTSDSLSKCIITEEEVVNPVKRNKGIEIL